MIRGLGVDLVQISRIEGLLERHGDRALERLFTEGERRGADGRARQGEYYAARFAAKEAFLKAVGIGMTGDVSWQEVEVRREDGGNPWLRLSGDAERRMEERGASRAHVSLSHEGGHAVAVVVLED